MMLLTKQYDNNPVNKYITCFKTNVKAIKMTGGEKVLSKKAIMDQKWFDLAKNGTIEEKTKLPKLSSEAFKATCLVMGSKDSQFAVLMKNLVQSIYVGKDEYPKTMQGAYKLLVNTTLENQNKSRKSEQRNTTTAVNFAQRQGNNVVPGGNGVVNDLVGCYWCNKFGHMQTNAMNQVKTNNNKMTLTITSSSKF